MDCERKYAGRLDMEAYQTQKCTWSLEKDPNNPDPHMHTKV